MTMVQLVSRISELVTRASSLREDISWAELDERRWLREELQGVYEEIAQLQAQKEAMTLRS